MNWRLWTRQITAIATLELKRFLLARRWTGVYLVTLAPVLLMFLRFSFASSRFEPVGALTGIYANLFHFFELRFAFFMGSAAVFTQLFRGDILEKTLHFYLLVPARREVIAVGKYVAGVAFVSVLFVISTVGTHLLIYAPSSEFGAFFLEGPGLSHLLRYVAVALLAGIVYGALFMLVGVRFKNSGVVTVGLLAWESLSFALPSTFQMFSVVHYFQGLLPVAVDRGPFAVLSEPVPSILGIPALLAATAAFLAASGWLVRSTQVTYSAD